MAEDTIRDRVTRFLEPTSSDVRRAKRAMLAVLEDGRSHRTPALLEAAAAVLGAEPWIEKLELTIQAAPSTDAISVDDPVLMYIRSRLAGNRAIADLAVAGVIAPATDPENDEQRHDRIVTREEPITIGISHPSSSSGIRVPIDRASIAQAYMLAEPAEVPWWMDPDLFVEELAGLDLTERAERALREALRAYRRRLYMACTALLGVVNEAAWYKAAERIGSSALAKLIEDGATAKLQAKVAESLRQVDRIGTIPDELLAHAAVLRDLRNYGVHPRSVRDDLERYFSEDTCALLIMETHHHLTTLGGAVDKALEEQS